MSEQAADASLPADPQEAPGPLPNAATAQPVLVQNNVLTVANVAQHTANVNFAQALSTVEAQANLYRMEAQANATAIMRNRMEAEYLVLDVERQAKAEVEEAQGQAAAAITAAGEAKRKADAELAAFRAEAEARFMALQRRLEEQENRRVARGEQAEEADAQWAEKYDALLRRFNAMELGRREDMLNAEILQRNAVARARVEAREQKRGFPVTLRWETA